MKNLIVLVAIVICSALVTVTEASKPDKKWAFTKVKIISQNFYIQDDKVFGNITIKNGSSYRLKLTFHTLLTELRKIILSDNSSA